jgi:sulfide dehydrogenase [flavocytochrome c] flavoprotein chain
MAWSRREFIKWASASAALGITGCATTPAGGPSVGRVVVVGGGFAGATVSKYIRKWGPNVEVTLVERNSEFVSCPMSNLVIGGTRSLADLTMGYGGLAKYGVKVQRDEVTAVDTERRSVRLAGGDTLNYDRLVLAPGIELIYEAIPGLNNVAAQERIPAAWRAGAQTVALRRQLEAMRDGGVFAIHIPKSPYRCPPGPYERACQVASYLKHAKRRSKVLILDANDDVQSKKGLFTKAWNERFKGLVEYRPNSGLLDVNPQAMTLKLEVEDIHADVINVIPPQRAGKIAVDLGLNNVNNRFCAVDFLSYESAVARNVHVIGDSIQNAPGTPKSASMANQQAKVCAAAIVALMNAQPASEQPMQANACYSFVDDKEAVHVAGVYKYDATTKTMVPVEGSGGLSAAPTAQEADYAWVWARNIWADALS